jgi:hypothetical protein
MGPNLSTPIHQIAASTPPRPNYLAWNGASTQRFMTGCYSHQRPAQFSSDAEARDYSANAGSGIHRYVRQLYLLTFNVKN